MTKHQRRELRKLSKNVQPRVKPPLCVEGKAADYEFEPTVTPKFPRSATLFQIAAKQLLSPFSAALEELAKSKLG